MAVATYTKTGGKSTTPAKLDKKVFNEPVKNHQLLKDAYLTYLANGRANSAKTKTRGLVRGGGRKPWAQKGLGRARFGSSRNPIWTGGGVAFGPTGAENYTRQLNIKAKRKALRQSLSMASQEDRIKVIEAFNFADGKTKTAAALLKKMDIAGAALLVVSQKETSTLKATNNLEGVKVVEAKYLNVFDLLNAEIVVMDTKSLEILQQWLAPSTNAQGKESEQ